ncbi:MAG: DUF4286 family protein [Flavobacteriales bacterium]
MVLYNLSIAVLPQQSMEWQDYMRTKHIPEIMSSGCFIQYRICLIPPMHDAEMTFAVQYVAPSEAHFERYKSDFAPALQSDYQKRFGQTTGVFRTVLKIIEEGSAPLREL